jgi:hypothetical protein
VYESDYPDGRDMAYTRIPESERENGARIRVNGWKGSYAKYANSIVTLDDVNLCDGADHSVDIAITETEQEKSLSVTFDKGLPGEKILKHTADGSVDTEDEFLEEGGYMFMSHGALVKVKDFKAVDTRRVPVYDTEEEPVIPLPPKEGFPGWAIALTAGGGALLAAGGALLILKRKRRK